MFSPILLRDLVTILIETDRKCHLDDIWGVTTPRYCCEKGVWWLYVDLGYTMLCEH